jgi:hypothetical protein
VTSLTKNGSSSAHHFDPKNKRGAASIHPKRILVNTIIYINKTGAQ